jgi:iron complex outermembrane receptor protein
MRKPSFRLRSLSSCLIGAGLTLAPGLGAAAADAAQAATGTLRVTVVAVGAPVAGATVSASGVAAATDASGIATLAMPPGSVSVIASKYGHGSATARVDVVAGAEREVRLVMAPSQPNANPIAATTRTGRQIDEQAFHVETIGRDRIEITTLRSPGDVVGLFNQMPGVRVQTTSPVLGTTVARIQGLPGPYTRLFFDGVPFFSDRPGGHALLRIPATDLERVEILKGPATALFGSDVAAGVINFLSRKPGATPAREFLINQASRNATDAVLWLTTPADGTWSSTFLFSAHRQEEADVDDDGWSDLPKYERIAARPRVFWDNGRGRTISGVADVTFEKREGGSAFAREALETRTATGTMFGQMILGNGNILAGAGTLFVQSRTRDFSDGRERDRPQMATLEITMRRPSVKHTWLAGLAADWYVIRSRDALPSQYVSSRGGIFVQDDVNVAPWLLVSGALRLDHHNLYGLQISPRGSALVRRGEWSGRVSASQGYFTPRLLTAETEAAGLARLTVAETLEEETVRSVSADVAYRTDAAALTLTLFRNQIDDPARIDRTTYTLRSGVDPIVTRGVEISGTVRRAPFSLTGAYTHVRSRERGGGDLALTPRHSAGFLAAAESGRGRIGVEIVYTGEQRLERNPFRSTSEPFVVAGLLGEYRVGRWRVFVNADNLTDVRQTDWDPIARPLRDIDGRWTVDAWAPLDGRVINGGLRISF